MKQLPFFCSLLIILLGCVIKSEENKDKEQYLIMVSIDGFRYDYAEKYNAKNILKIADQGVRAESLIPPYPSKTFPSHYSIVTGLYPQNHGIVDNYFYDKGTGKYYNMKDSSVVSDGKWYGGTPIWALAGQNNVLNASYFWVGSEAEIKGYRPNYYYGYSKTTSINDRVEQTLKWLNLPTHERPRLITLYFSLVDQAGHDFGPESIETAQAVRDIDKGIGNLLKAMAQTDLPVNLILVSDHGMTSLKEDKKVYLKEYMNWKKVNYLPRDAFMMIYTTDSVQKDSIYTIMKNAEQGRFTTYRKEDIPSHLNYNKGDRIGDILLMAKPPYIFSEKTDKHFYGTHGYDPYEYKEMHGIFYATGPSIKEGLTIPSFENIHIYPLLAHILNMKYDENGIDGKKEVLQTILK